MLSPVGGEQPLMVGRKGVQMRGAGPVSAPAWGLLPAVLAVAVTGCTMCPDPYDYSGPVPNGSPPQNDFRARSNGILPIGGTPQPWPAIVKKPPATTRAPHVIARGEVKQLSAEKQVAGKEEPPAEQAVSEVPAAPPTKTQNTVAVIGEAEEIEADSEKAAAESSPDDPATGDIPAEPSSESTDASETEADAAVSEDDETIPATEQAASPESVAPQLPPEPPATGDSTAGESAEDPETDETSAEPAAVDPPPVPMPTPVLRETPGWRPRRPLSFGVFAP